MSCAPGGIGPKGGRRSTNSLVAEPQQVGEVGLAAEELAHRQRPLGAREMLAQIRFKPAGIEPLVRPLVDQLGGFERLLHQRPACFETRRSAPLLSMTEFVDGITNVRHPEEARSAVSKGVAAAAHFRSSTRATARLWTSSGPSTMRTIRERAQA